VNKNDITTVAMPAPVNKIKSLEIILKKIVEIKLGFMNVETQTCMSPKIFTDQITSCWSNTFL
jgi:hypothetical protein